MATIRYEFNLDASLKSVFITDDVAGTTTVEVRQKSNNALVVSAPLATWQMMIRNISEWGTLRSTDNLLLFSKT